MPNYSGAICSKIKGGISDHDTIARAIPLSETTMNILVKKLCQQKVIEQHRDRLVIVDAKRADMLILEHDGLPELSHKRKADDRPSVANVEWKEPELPLEPVKATRVNFKDPPAVVEFVEGGITINGRAPKTASGITIDHDIPLPGEEPKYPFQNLTMVGWSMGIPIHTLVRHETVADQVAAVAKAGRKFGAGNGWRFKVMEHEIEGRKHIRCWRIEDKKTRKARA